MSFATDLGELFLNKNIKVMISVEKNTFKYSDYELSDNYILSGNLSKILSDSICLETQIGLIVINTWNIVAVSEESTELKDVFAFKRK